MPKTARFLSPQTVAETLTQVIEGEDIPKPKSLLRNITPEKAARKLPHMPYSILTNLAHTDFWQTLWLNKLKGLPRKSITEDWRVPNPDEWQEVRESFLAGLDEAHAIAAAQPFKHKMRSDEAAVNTLIALAIHNAYHLGQINLLKRAMRLGNESG
ncbi:MAG: DinB family protein [Armatimonadetes bacterium]|nr:DinB family protein [Armatimonadota bacterium]